MSVIKNFRQQDEKLASGYDTVFRNKLYLSLNPNVRQLGIVSPLSYPSHPDLRQVRDNPVAGTERVTVRVNR